MLRLDVIAMRSAPVASRSGSLRSLVMAWTERFGYLAPVGTGA